MLGREASFRGLGLVVEEIEKYVLINGLTLSTTGEVNTLENLPSPSSTAFPIHQSVSLLLYDCLSSNTQPP